MGDESFSLTGKCLIEAGFTAIMKWLAIDEDDTLPDLRQGDRLPLTFEKAGHFPYSKERCREAKLSERVTTPPDYLTESELISLMEKHGIGTDASIPTHMNNIAQRNYVTVRASRLSRRCNTHVDAGRVREAIGADEVGCRARARVLGGGSGIGAAVDARGSRDAVESDREG